MMSSRHRLLCAVGTKETGPVAGHHASSDAIVSEKPRRGLPSRNSSTGSVSTRFVGRLPIARTPRPASTSIPTRVHWGFSRLAAS